MNRIFSYFLLVSFTFEGLAQELSNIKKIKIELLMGKLKQFINMKSMNIAYIIMCMPLLMGTSCSRGGPVKIEFELSKCPSKEFVLPFEASNKEVAVKVEWLSDSRYDIKRIKDLSEEKDIYREINGFSKIFQAGLLRNDKACSLILISSGFVEPRKFSKEIIVEHVKGYKELLVDIAKAFFADTKFQIVGEPSFEWIEDEDLDRLVKSFQPKPLYPVPSKF